MKEIFKDAKVGDRVWDISMGWGKITKYTSDKYPIRVAFDKQQGFYYGYKLDGRTEDRDDYPRLFWQEFQIPEEAYQKPLPKLEVDTKVLVSTQDAPSIWYTRYFSHFEPSGKIHCFDSGATSWSAEGRTNVWSNWKLADEN